MSYSELTIRVDGSIAPNTEDPHDGLTVEQWLQVRKEVGRSINPETAWVMWIFAVTADPYGVYPDIQEKLCSVNREYFACDPERNIWVCFDDLPEETRETLWKMHQDHLAFAAGLHDGTPFPPATPIPPAAAAQDSSSRRNGTSFRRRTRIVIHTR